MNHHGTPGDDNVARLLNQAYDPPQPSADFAARVRARLLSAGKRPAPARRLPQMPRRFLRLAAAAALLAAIGVGLYLTSPDSPGVGKPSVSGVNLLTEGGKAGPRPPVPPGEPLVPGQTVTTGAGERKRVVLPDNSVLYVNQNSVVYCDAARKITLTSGEVFVEVSPRSPTPEGTFVVQTPKRAVTALGTKFAVRADESGTGVTVTQGKVKVSDLDGVLAAGQQLLACSTEVTEAPRASHVLDWARDLMAASENPLVPSRKHPGGALVIVDTTTGQEAPLTMRKFHVDVHIEDGYARTTIDQTYFNHLAQRQEGTFLFPLPPDASLSRLAMYVANGSECDLMEGGMVEREQGRQIFESIVRRQKDPALLEWVDGNTFKMRVFPLEGRQEKRIVLSYTQKLNGLYGKTSYRFPNGHNLNEVGHWSFHARLKASAGHAWQCDTHQLKATKDGADLVLDGEARQVRLERDVLLTLTDPHTGANAIDTPSFAMARHDGNRYFQVRLRPDLKSDAKRGKREWFFLVETSFERDPVLARTQIEIVRSLLSQAEHDDTFTVVTAGARANVLDGGMRPVTPANASAAVAFLDAAQLAGALDLEQGFEAVLPLLKEAKNPHIVHIGSGLTVLGERRPDALARALPRDARYVGVAVGKRWNRTLMKLLAERTGGYVTQINPDEPVAWRAFEVYSILNTPRLLGIKVADADSKLTFLCHSSNIAQGEELCAIARSNAPDAPLPETVVITGTLDGKEYKRELKVEKVAGGADYLPRSWGRLEVERMLVEGAEQHKDALIALSKSLYVMTPYTSLLVLENEQMYRDFNVDRGRKDHWALYPCPDKIPVVYEPLPGMGQAVVAPPPPVAPAPGKKTVDDVLKTMTRRATPNIVVFPSYQAAQGNLPKDAGDKGPMLDFSWDGGRYEFQQRSYTVRVPITMTKSSGEVQYRTVTVTPTSGYYVGGKVNYAPKFGINGPGWAYDNGAFGSGRMTSGGRIGNGSSSGDSGLIGPGGIIFRDVTPSGERTAEMDPKAYKKLEETYLLRQLDDLVRTRGRDDFETTDQRMFQLETQTELLRAKLRKDMPPDDGYKPVLLRTHADLYAEAQERARQQLRDIAEGGEMKRKVGDIKDMIKDTGRPGKFDRDPRGWGEGKEGEAGESKDKNLRRFYNRGLSPVTIYQRPEPSGEVNVFRDLVAYAPGLHNNNTDVLGVLEAEDAVPAPKLGIIEDKARALIDKARAAGWQRILLAGSDNGTIFVCDGSGRYHLERTLSTALKEVVICDGKTLLHLYPELGLAARRSVTRFYRAELTQMVPWALPPVEDLARGADVRLVDERTVAIVGDQGLCVMLVFAADGRLAERQVADKPGGKVLAREVYGTDGSVKRIVGDKETTLGTWVIHKAHAPELEPDLKEQVVLPLPCRTREHVLAAHKMMAIGDPEKLDADVAMELIAAEFASSRDQLVALVTHRFLFENDRRAGFYVLLFSGGQLVQNLPHPKRSKLPIEDYIAELERGVYTHYGRFPGDDFAARMTNVVAIVWGAPTNSAQPPAVPVVVQFVKECRSTWQVWVVTATVLKHANLFGGAIGARHVLEAALPKLEGIPDLEYAGRYEHASLLCQLGESEKGYAELLKLYEDSLSAGEIPPVSVGFFDAIRGDPSGTNLRKFAADLTAKGHGLAVIILAEQATQLGLPDIGPILIDALTANRDKAKESTSLTLALLQYHANRGAWDLASLLVDDLLKDTEAAASPALWRVASQVAMQRGQTKIAMDRLEKALDLEFKQDFGVLNLDEVRRDYQLLLQHYGRQSEAMVLLEQKAPPGFVAKVTRTVDRWKTLDPMSAATACQHASYILRQAGEPERAWDYATFALGSTTDAAQFLALAQQMQVSGERLHADRAYATAFALQPTNADYLWLRAVNLADAGRMDRARQLFGELAEGPWDAQFQKYQPAARERLAK
jgi:tetratricopeptide (TPR) repeat protein